MRMVSRTAHTHARLWPRCCDTKLSQLCALTHMIHVAGKPVRIASLTCDIGETDAPCGIGDVAPAPSQLTALVTIEDISRTTTIAELVAATTAQLQGRCGNATQPLHLYVLQYGTTSETVLSDPDEDTAHEIVTDRGDTPQSTQLKRLVRLSDTSGHRTAAPGHRTDAPGAIDVNHDASTVSQNQLLSCCSGGPCAGIASGSSEGSTAGLPSANTSKTSLENVQNNCFTVMVDDHVTVCTTTLSA